LPLGVGANRPVGVAWREPPFEHVGMMIYFTSIRGKSQYGAQSRRRAVITGAQKKRHDWDHAAMKSG